MRILFIKSNTAETGSATDAKPSFRYHQRSGCGLRGWRSKSSIWHQKRVLWFDDCFLNSGALQRVSKIDVKSKEELLPGYYPYFLTVISFYELSESIPETFINTAMLYIQIFICTEVQIHLNYLKGTELFAVALLLS